MSVNTYKINYTKKKTGTDHAFTVDARTKINAEKRFRQQTGETRGSINSVKKFKGVLKIPKSV